MYNNEFGISSVSETNGKTIVRTGENTYSGIVSLADINNHEKVNIVINLLWNNNESNNKNDYELGKSADVGIFIPVIINLKQYNGSEILIPYEEPGE